MKRMYVMFKRRKNYLEYMLKLNFFECASYYTFIENDFKKEAYSIQARGTYKKSISYYCFL